jgi:predicted enzyme related to lactoylglutathione lyase
MSDPFVWFDLRTRDADVSRSFHEKLFGWAVAEVAVGDDKAQMIGAEKPWASIVADSAGEHLGWFPYIQVDNLQAATQRATELGATALQAATEGPAGMYTPIREPGGAVFALFQPRS